MQEVRVPDIGDFADVPVVEVAVAVGDHVAAEDTLVVVESDKATLDVPAPFAGRVLEMRVAEGDTVSEGSVILILEADAGEAEAAASAPVAREPVVEAPPAGNAAAARPAPKPRPASVAEGPVPPAVEPGKPVYASPSVRRYARTLGVAVGEVSGSAAKGRITREDIEAFVKARLAAPPAVPAAGGAMAIAGLPDWPVVDFAKFGPVERVPLSRIGRISGPALARNAMVIPHVTNFDKADVTDLEAFRKTLNGEAGPDEARLTMLAFAVKAVVAALKAYPKFNSSLDGDELVVKNYWNIGVAADTPDGLVVPVVKEADRKGLREIAGEMAGLAEAARAGKLKPADMQGATFTISSLGGIGGTNFTPIINAPEVAILGMTRADIQPVWDGEAFQPRLIQPLSLSWDHRVVDGVAAARFLVHVARTLGDFRRIAV
jgi:pyruvate dehydrogenase E2 component (dihydrolipoamide acetyltransferase)